MKRLLSITLMLLFLCGICACTSDEPGTPDEVVVEPIAFKSIQMNATDVEVAKAEQDFGFALFNAYAECQQELGERGNYMVSPLNVAIELSMLANTTQAKTYETIIKALGYSDLQSLNDYNAKLLEYLPVYNEDMKLALANNVWFDISYSAPGSEYVTLMNNVYKAEPEHLDFRKKEESLAVINNWAKTNTFGLIPQVIEDFGEDQPMTLASALYFNAPWEEPFSEDKTSDKIFVGARGETRVPMMSNFTTAEYSQLGEVKMLKLPTKGNRAAMYFVLPSKTEDIHEFACGFTGEKFAELADGLKSTAVSIQLPKFKNGGKTVLDDILAKLGVDKEGMIISDSVLAEAPYLKTMTVHYATIEVSERGVEAGAVTIEEEFWGSSLQHESFVADHPFIYFLMEEETGSLLMAGAVLDPLK